MKHAKYTTILISISFLFFIFNNAFAQERISIVPTPKKIITRDIDTRLDIYWSIVVDKSNERDLSSARYLMGRLNDEFNISLPIENRGTNVYKKNIELINLSIVSATEVDFYSEDISDLMGKEEESYLLDITKNKIIIVANDSPGIFFGIQTLFQLLKKDKDGVLVPSVKIIDYPQIKIRAVHFCGVNFEKIKQQLEYIARLKLNTVILESELYYNMIQGQDKLRIKELFAYARQLFIEPIPGLQSFGGAGAIISKDPYCAEGKWIQDEHFRFKNDIAVPIIPLKKSLINVIRTDSTDIEVKNLGKTKIYKKDKDYKIITISQITAPYLKEIPTRIVRLPRGNIKDGEEVLVSYDQIIWQPSFAEWKIPYCPSEPRTYNVMFSALKNVIELVNPKYISIGHDEIRGMNKDSRCKKRNMSNAELLAEDIAKLDNFVKDIDPEVKLLMWDDMVNPWHNGGEKNYQVQYGGIFGKTSSAIDLISKDIILMIWWGETNDWLNKMKNSPDYFESKGFTYLVAGYKDKKNIQDWIEIIKDRKKCLGIITPTWDGWEKNIEGIKYVAEMAWH